MFFLLFCPAGKPVGIANEIKTQIHCLLQCCAVKRCGTETKNNIFDLTMESKERERRCSYLMATTRHIIPLNNVLLVKSRLDGPFFVVLFHAGTQKHSETRQWPLQRQNHPQTLHHPCQYWQWCWNHPYSWALSPSGPFWVSHWHAPEPLLTPAAPW